MVCIGHVDAGKSTIMGQLLVQTGQVTKRQAARQSVAGGTTNTGNTGNNASNASANQQPNLAWLLDETVSERERGVTMEIGTKCLTTQGKNQHQIVMLDAPGHADFIPIMITGAAHADAALLVVDAVTGEFEAGFQGGGQTKEHLSLAKGLGVTQIIVAINKLDVEGYQQERYEAVKEQLLHYLVHTQKFKPARIQCVPVSGLTGENIFQQTEPLLREWYQGGPTLLQAMDRFKLPIAGNRQLGESNIVVACAVYCVY
jgi:elongation factor 1 alpha-like protein